MTSPQPYLTVVIPTRDVAGSLRSLLPALTSGIIDVDIVVADGGSNDGTVDVAARHQARVTVAEGGRGPQIRAGIDAGLGNWVFVLHADSVLPNDWDRLVLDFMTDPSHSNRAGYFDFALDDTAAAARRLERMVKWRCRTFGLPYGDQGLLISKGFLAELGGYPEHALMEDVAVVRRIGRERLVALGAPIVTSAVKFRRDGYVLRSIRNLLCLGLYFIGLPPRAIRRVYG